MSQVPTGAGVWLATGYTDMRRGFPSLAPQVQEVLREDPLSGHLFVFRGRRSHLVKVIWHDGQHACSPKTGERAVHVAFGCGRSGDDLTGADELPVVRNRLAQPARNPASDADRIAVLGLNLLLDLIRRLHDVEAGTFHRTLSVP
jgi:hypothetical protein